MALALEDLKTLKHAEKIADTIWEIASKWSDFGRDTLGKQITRATDSIGANIAESFGRFNYGEKIQFLYYARGSLFESKYWLNRAYARRLISMSDYETLTIKLTETAKSINRHVNSLKTYKQTPNTTHSALREDAPPYTTAPNPDDVLIIDIEDLHFLAEHENNP